MSHKKKITIWLKPNAFYSNRYDIVKMQNTVEYAIGQTLTKSEIENLIAIPYITINVGAGK